MANFVKKMQKRLANNKRKGFTLVELIVVLVILAILAAMLVPALTGYIDKARQRGVLVEARNVLTAVQAAESEKYGVTGSVWNSSDEKATTATEISTLVGSGGLLEGYWSLVDGDYDKTAKITFETDDHAKVTSLTYTTAKYTVSYTDGAWGNVTNVTA